MNLKGFDLNLLVALDALLEERNVTRAGKRVHLSQSAMSGALARLREYYGDPLLVQEGRNFLLTPVANDLIGPVRSILMQMESTLEVKQSFMPSLSKRIFRVMASDYGSIVLVSEVMRAIKETAPEVGVEIMPFTDTPLEALERGEIDILLISKGYTSQSHPYEQLISDRYVIVCSACNRLIKEDISLEQMFGLGHVAVKYGKYGTAHNEEKYFQSRGLKRRIDVTTTSFSAVPHFILGTDRITVMPERLARVYARSLPLRLLEPPLHMPILEEAMQWHVYLDQDAGNVWLRMQLKSVAEQMGG
jgi:DNA-binding transcriptional LysR family regulator